MKTLIFADLSEEQVKYLETLASENSINLLITHPTKKKNFRRIRKVFKKALTEQELNMILDIREDLDENLQNALYVEDILSVCNRTTKGTFHTPPVLYAEDIDLPIPAHLQVSSALSAREKKAISMQTVVTEMHIGEIADLLGTSYDVVEKMKNDNNIVTFADALDMHQLPANIKQVIEGWL